MEHLLDFCQDCRNGGEPYYSRLFLQSVCSCVCACYYHYMYLGQKIKSSDIFLMTKTRIQSQAALYEANLTLMTLIKPIYNNKSPHKIPSIFGTGV